MRQPSLARLFSTLRERESIVAVAKNEHSISAEFARTEGRFTQKRVLIVDPENQTVTKAYLVTRISKTN